MNLMNLHSRKVSFAAHYIQFSLRQCANLWGFLAQRIRQRQGNYEVAAVHIVKEDVFADELINAKAIGIQASENGGVKLTTKKSKNQNRPASNLNSVSWGSNKSNRK